MVERVRVFREPSLLNVLTNNERFNEPSVRSINISKAQGGTMLKVIPLARQGYSPKEIAHLTGISHVAVLSAERKLRKKGIIPESHREFHRRSVEALKNLPEDPYNRLQLLKTLTFNLYWENRDMFVTVSQ